MFISGEKLRMAPWISCFFFAFFLILICYSPTAQPFDYPAAAANLSTTWTNDDTAPNAVNFQDGSMVIPILVGPKFACGFICNEICISYYFGIFIVNITDGYDFSSVSPQVVWLANRDDPVGLGARLTLSADGDLVLNDFVGNTAWTTKTSGKSVVGMNLTDAGNLVLFGVRGLVIWQSFDHPTDCLLPGQELVPGQKLIASVSSTNWTTQQSLYSFSVAREGLFAYFESHPVPSSYYNSTSSYPFSTDNDKKINFVRFSNGSLSVFYLGDQPNTPFLLFNTSLASATQYMKLMSDGHLKVFEWKNGWSVVADLLTNSGESNCGRYPLACGKNSLCSREICSCPGSSYPVKGYYRPVNDNDQSLGCYETNPLTCNATQDQEFIVLPSYNQFTSVADMEAVNEETCRQACRENCSCKAAIFHNQYDIYGNAKVNGLCYLPSDLLTLTEDSETSSAVFIKVQKVRQSPSITSASQPYSRKGKAAKVLYFTIGSFLAILVVVFSFIVFIKRKQKMNAEMQEEYLDNIPGMPERFSYEGLKTATENFSKKLGEGGFGSVYEGTLEDGLKIAVKCLEGLAHVKKSFLAEVQSIGSIHHVNLVRLRGFCSWKSQRLLVYEFMSNGSLDRWIYHGDREHILEWECRRKIILDIAKGLAYLHEDCRQKIIHLDIKPQNILLDDDFNAKVSDFGLSKLIDRNQTQVMTTMRGTPGYLAPEWLSSVITEKVDVYSFGIVLLEILCGRKNFDIREPEESRHLLGVFQTSCEQGTLLDIVDKYCEDMQVNGPEVVEMMKVAAWCLQTDYTRRPAMSLVIKVLEGVMNVESNLDYNFSFARTQKTEARHEKDMTQLLPFFLSGPR